MNLSGSLFSRTTMLEWHVKGSQSREISPVRRRPFALMNRASIRFAHFTRSKTGTPGLLLGICPKLRSPIRSRPRTTPEVIDTNTMTIDVTGVPALSLFGPKGKSSKCQNQGRANYSYFSPSARFLGSCSVTHAFPQCTPSHRHSTESNLMETYVQGASARLQI
jgi:hypothetical protein